MFPVDCITIFNSYAFYAGITQTSIFLEKRKKKKEKNIGLHMVEAAFTENIRILTNPIELSMKNVGLYCIVCNTTKITRF